MEGMNDGRALKTIVPQVNPRKMVRQGNVLVYDAVHISLEF